LKGVVATILLQQFAVNAALSMEVIPEGRYGYTAEDRAKRMYCTVTIMEMAVFSLLLSYAFSHTSMTLSDVGLTYKGAGKAGTMSSSPAGALLPHAAMCCMTACMLIVALSSFFTIDARICVPANVHSCQWSCLCR
jgi:hypothetical protein